MNKREDKKEAILLAGMEVMKGNGYNGTSVKDIVDAAGVPKGSFYNYFESKEQFALDAISYAGDAGRDFASGVLGGNEPALTRLLNFFNCGISLLEQGEYKHGCFIGNMCQEMADVSDVMRRALDSCMRKTIAQVAAVIEQGQAAGEISKHAEPLVMAEFLFNAWEGAIMRAKAAKVRDPLDAFMAMVQPMLAASPAR